jgi:hypothetical protein
VIKRFGKRMLLQPISLSEVKWCKERDEKEEIIPDGNLKTSNKGTKGTKGSEERVEPLCAQESHHQLRVVLASCTQHE